MTNPSRSEPTSLYRCEKCGDVIRDFSGKDSLGHIHRDEAGNYLGKDGEGRYIEFEDDGRSLDYEHDLTIDADIRWRA